MDIDEWIKIGVDNKWCTPPVCGMHEPFFFTEEEERELDEGCDPCYTVLRLFSDASDFDSASENNPHLFC